MIDKIDKRILFELEKNARIPDTKLAKKVRMSKDTVKYRIKKMESEGIIKNYKTWIDYSKIGYRTSTVYLTLRNFPSKKEKLIQDIRKDKRVYWYGVAEGIWNIGITYFIKTNNELFEIKKELFLKYGNLISDIKLTSLVGVSVHEKTFLVDENSSFVTFTEETGFYELENIEKKILKSIYFNSRMNLSEIADKCDSTIDIVRNRIKKLEKNKIIIRYTIEINYTKLGYELYKTFLYLVPSGKEDLDSLMKYAEKSNKIIHVVKQISSWDLEFIVFAENFEDYIKILNGLTEKFPLLINKFETAIMSEDVIFPCKEVYF